MATNEVNIGVGRVSGMFYHAAISDELVMPVSPFDDFDAAFKEVGYVSEDGPSWTPYGSIDPIRAWSLATLRNVKSEKGSVTVPVISTTGESLKTVFGAGAVTETAATRDHGNLVKASTVNGPHNVPEAFLLVGQDGTDGILLSTSDGIVTDIAEVGFTPTGAIIWSITITGDWEITKDDGEVSA